MWIYRLTTVDIIVIS